MDDELELTDEERKWVRSLMGGECKGETEQAIVRLTRELRVTGQLEVIAREMVARLVLALRGEYGD